MADQWQAALDVLQAQINNLQNTIQQQNAQIVAGNAQNAALAAAQAQWQLPAANITRKVETLADPGHYSGKSTKFMEWWTKMKVWIRVNNADDPPTCLQQGNSSLVLHGRFHCGQICSELNERMFATKPLAGL